MLKLKHSISLKRLWTFSSGVLRLEHLALWGIRKRLKTVKKWPFSADFNLCIYMISSFPTLLGLWLLLLKPSYSFTFVQTRAYIRELFKIENLVRGTFFQVYMYFSFAEVDTVSDSKRKKLSLNIIWRNSVKITFIDFSIFISVVYVYWS